MTPVVTQYTTHKHGAPQGWDPAKDGGPCGTLPASRDESGKVWISFWVPTPAELDAIIKGCPIQFGVYATQHPVVQLSAGDNPVAYKDPITQEDIFTDPANDVYAKGPRARTAEPPPESPIDPVAVAFES